MCEDLKPFLLMCEDLVGSFHVWGFDTVSSHVREFGTISSPM